MSGKGREEVGGGPLGDEEAGGGGRVGQDTRYQATERSESSHQNLSKKGHNA